jgi:hypothetical protein
MNEIDKIKERYEKRKLLNGEKRNDDLYFPFYSKCERERIYLEIFSHLWGINSKLSGKNIIEIGAGSGDNLLAFKRFGFEWENIYANELLDERVSLLKKNIPQAHIFPGDACVLDFNESFDIVFQSTVFTSILNQEFKIKLADHMYKMTKMEGLISWYDFRYNNPKNPDVKGVGKNEIRQLFPHVRRMKFHHVTLAPPLARRIGKYYNIFNFIFPFLRTHLIAEIYK